MMNNEEESFPFRIIIRCGAAFTAGMIAGGVFHGINGFRNAPSGLRKRFQGSVSSITQGAPIFASKCAVWAMMYSTIDYSLNHIRKSDDPWNSSISAAATGGILTARKGVKVMVVSALVSGLVFATLGVMIITAKSCIFLQLFH